MDRDDRRHPIELAAPFGLSRFRTYGMISIQLAVVVSSQYQALSSSYNPR